MTMNELHQLVRSLPEGQRNLPVALWHAGKATPVESVEVLDANTKGLHGPCILISGHVPPPPPPATEPVVAHKEKK